MLSHLSTFLFHTFLSTPDPGMVISVLSVAMALPVFSITIKQLITPIVCQKSMGLIAFENYKLTAHATSVLKICTSLMVFDSADR